MLHASSLRKIVIGASAVALILAGACSDSAAPGGGDTAGGDTAGGDTAGGGEAGSSHDPSDGGAATAGSSTGGASGDLAAGAPSVSSGGGGAGGAPDESSAGAAVSGAGAGAAGDGGAGGAANPFEGCDYVERDDLDNDLDQDENATPEDTNLVLNRPITICGRLDPGHFDGDAADVDRFTFYQEVPDPDRDLIFHLRTEGASGDADVGMQFTYTWSDVVSGKAVISQRAIGEELRIAVAALSEAITEPISYRLRIDFDAPDVRCPRVTSAASYVESSDGPSHHGNDVYTLDDVDFLFTSETTDAPEVTNLTIGTGSSYRLSGNAADVAQIGNYLDADTYAIHTGPTTDQLTIRGDWPSGTNDFDYELVRADSLEIQAGGTDLDNVRELHTFTVEPDTTYWLWVAPYADGADLPTAYDVSICGESFDF